MIATARLVLEPFTTTTAQATADGERRDLPWAEEFPREDDRQAAAMFLRAPHDVFGSWFIVVRDGGGVVGTIGFFGPPKADGDVMVGYGLVPAARGHGYATEALLALTRHGLAQPGVARILAETDAANVASHRVLEKGGFVLVRSGDTEHLYAAANSVDDGHARA